MNTIPIKLDSYLLWDDLLSQLPPPSRLDPNESYSLNIEYPECRFINDHLCQI